MNTANCNYDLYERVADPRKYASIWFTLDASEVPALSSSAITTLAKGTKDELFGLNCAIYHAKKALCHLFGAKQFEFIRGKKLSISPFALYSALQAKLLEVESMLLHVLAILFV
jgi:hypothetical protein